MWHNFLSLNGSMINHRAFAFIGLIRFQIVIIHGHWIWKEITCAPGGRRYQTARLFFFRGRLLFNHLFCHGRNRHSHDGLLGEWAAAILFRSGHERCKLLRRLRSHAYPFCSSFQFFRQKTCCHRGAWIRRYCLLLIFCRAIGWWSLYWPLSSGTFLRTGNERLHVLGRRYSATSPSLARHGHDVGRPQHRSIAWDTSYGTHHWV